MQNTTPKKQLPAYAVLAIIALVAALVLGLTHFVTAEPIARHQREALNKAFGTVMPLPEGGSYQQITEGLEGYDVSSLYSARDAQGNVVGYCVTASKKGYGGPVAVTLGVDAQGKVTGCVVGDTSFAESAGFGTRALEEPFREQFIGLDAVEGGTIEKLTGATVTSTAVLGATNEALRTVSEVVLGKPVDGGNLVSFGVKQAPQVDLSTLVPGGTMKGSAEGYGGESVQVTITLDDACLIATVKVDASTQTPGIGQRCATDEGFLNSFVGKSLPVEVDVLSGATITSQAVVDAINGAEAAEPEAQAVMPVADVVASDDHATLGLYEDGTAQVSAAEGFTGTVNVAVNVVEGKVQGGTVSSALPTAEPLPENALTGSAPGFDDDPVSVVVTLNADGTIASLTVDASNQMAGIGAVCEKEEFTSQFIGKTGPFSVDNIDVCSGATYTSKGVIEAVNSVLPAAETSAPVEEAAPVAEALTGSAPGFDDDPVSVVVTLNADGTIASLTVDASNQMAGIGAVCEKEEFTSQFIGKSGPFSVDNIDVCSGATYTSKGVIEAVNSVLPAAETSAPVAEALTGSAPGFDDDPVSVVVTLNADGTIASLTVDASNQMAGIGAVCEKEEFTSQFIGKSGPFSVDNIDVCSGATYTSKGVIEAVNSVLPAAETSAPVASEAAALTGSAPGFDDDPVSVVVTLNADGTIASLTVDASNQMAGIGAVCEKEEFTSQFIGKTGPFSVDNIDVCSGATYTSKGVIEAVNSVLPAAETSAPVEEAAPAVTPDPASEFKATAEGYEEDVVVYITLNADGAIATLRVDASGDTPAIGGQCEKEAFTSQFIGKSAPFSTDNVDVISGATYTSKAVIEAVNRAAKKAAQ